MPRHEEARGIGDLVKAIRVARGLTQENLARELGVTFSTVNGWENGKHRPLPFLMRIIVRLASETGVSVPPGLAQATLRRRGRG